MLFLSLSAILASRACGDGAVRTVVLTGRQAPDLDSGVNFTTFNLRRGGFPALNDHGRVVFPAGMAGPGITANVNDGGVWVESSQGLVLVAQGDDDAPGDPTGIKLSTILSPSLNNSGQVGLLNFIKGVPIVVENRHGLFLTEPEGINLAPVARGSDPAPGAGPDATFRRPDGLNFNDAGQAVLYSDYDSPSGVGTGVWRFSLDNGLELLAKNGDAAPGLPPGVVYASVNSTQINASGQILFKGFVSGGGVTDQDDNGLWTADAGGNVSLLVREGDSAPGTPSDVKFKSISIPALNDAGGVAMTADLRGPGVTANNFEGIWSTGAGGGLTLVARDGNPAPGTPAGVVFGFGPGVPRFPALNNAGQTAFYSGLAGSGVNTSNDVGLWSEGGGAGLQLVMREGDLAPGTSAGVRFSIADPGGLFTSALNDAGHVAFGSRLTGTGVTTANNQGIWAQDPNGVVQLIVRTGQSLDVDDGPGIDLRTISELNRTIPQTNLAHPAIVGFNDRGQLLFQARFTDGTEGLFVSNLVAQTTADFNGDAVVDGTDFLTWQRHVGLDTGLAVGEQGDADLDGRVDGADLAAWTAQFGVPITPTVAPVPEPSVVALLFVPFLLTCSPRWGTSGEARTG